MTELITEIILYLAIAALIGVVIGYLIWGWGRRAAMAAARAEGAAAARTSVDGNVPLRAQLDAALDERDELQRENADLRAALTRRGRAVQPAESPELVAVTEGAMSMKAAQDVASEAERYPPEEEIYERVPRSVFADPDPDDAPYREPSGQPPASLLSDRPAEVDDLKWIKGVGPVMEKVLNDKGIYLFHQVANFTDQDVDWVNDAIDAFPGRIARDRWVEQAQDLYREKYGKAHDV